MPYYTDREEGQEETAFLLLLYPADYCCSTTIGQYSKKKNDHQGGQSQEDAWHH
eukprot:CAMPEP_0197299982 /NCGR_PEP_ID=MMETSP0890-20130614/47277_1 /TAXON_ID=44058 ORGANISM="Aureoumbra lagunensis, Strain CCMP1510" /NCGR_SAMPLE_ID=MMETSP0890 /ASSEMBLY_ACC=CAM_ASM_000533 /LENGTH=53 /DNA_ID=CAMNT_0042778563 /DNA_START=134 /DNA_END=295 /DNA_ORIENTATION=+